MRKDKEHPMNNKFTKSHCRRIKICTFTVHTSALYTHTHIFICTIHRHSIEKSNCAVILWIFVKVYKFVLSHKIGCFFIQINFFFCIYAEANISFYVHFPCNMITIDRERQREKERKRGNQQTYSTSDVFRRCI